MSGISNVGHEPRFEYFDGLARERDQLIEELVELGGIDFTELKEQKPTNYKGSRKFKLLPGFTYQSIPLGFKEPGTRFGSTFTLIQEVATLNHIHRAMPVREALLPRIFYDVYEFADDEKVSIGTLTEDFSEHGKLVSIFEGSLHDFENIYSRPEVIERDHTAGMVGYFAIREAGALFNDSKKAIIDAYPIYAIDELFKDGRLGDYRDWFTDETGIDIISTRIDELRIDADTIRR